MSSYLNERQKEGLPSYTVANTNNDAHIMEIVSSSGRTLGSNVINLEEGPNKMGVEEQVS